MISDQTYLNWQKKLQSSRWYRRFWSWWGLYSVLLFFVIGLYFLLYGRWKILILALAALLLARYVFSPLIYLIYKRSRPYQKLDFKTYYWFLLSRITSRKNSFPSDHAAGFAALSCIFYFYFPALGTALFFVTLFNGWGRVVLGYHYFTDILAGWAVGLISALLVAYFLAPLLFTH